MAEYYLISQLPSLDGLGENSPIPISEERFTELCTQFLKKKTIKAFKSLTLSPSKKFEKSGSVLIDSWNESERNLRFALEKIRSEKAKKTFDTENRTIRSEYLDIANTAVNTDNPMEAEKYLSNFRLGVLETLRPSDNFSEDYIFYYGLKLKLLLRLRQFDTELGEKIYKNIYNSILSGVELEEKQ